MTWWLCARKKNLCILIVVTQRIIFAFNILLSFCTKWLERCLAGLCTWSFFIKPVSFLKKHHIHWDDFRYRLCGEIRTYHVTRGAGQPATEQWNLTFCFSQIVWERGSITNSGACRSLSWFNFLWNAWVSSSWKRNIWL